MKALLTSSAILGAGLLLAGCTVAVGPGHDGYGGGPANSGVCPPGQAKKGNCLPGGGFCPPGHIKNGKCNARVGADGAIIIID